jgi:hypothetical protein
VVDASGNVGIGTASPTAKLDVRLPVGTDALHITDATRGDLYVDFPATEVTRIVAQYGSGGILAFANGTSKTERMRIDASGNLLVGTTSPAQTLSTNNVLTLKAPGVATTWGVGPTSSYGTFYISRGGTGVGLADGATSWGTVSDERNKDIIESITNATSKIATLRTVIGKYKTDEDGVRRSFLIAQDVQAVLPEAVDIQDDEQGTLSVRYTETIPLLVAAIKEQQAVIEEMKARLAALESK